ncbi:Cd(II)/Pb(II)-responsive transcriptional regulator [Suttonella sp. R2A3]|uniref:Cd(II)/Pb(II)-responsive transcriptional regulator n=1 Tax=Suttonella sp. R2A3 TaxID=2908648 RepID=UPI001F17A0C2|nr:Cd(II)/Pb(II)-responsive transcriptional regulator [Suttonella sp. R2A3]UJF25162.1 Cd(II)/Pb(II)-responsive transcriptional regulator [Suttonella sp. R2A3]
MKIGELAKKAGCPSETIRYYEREGLLPAADRDPENNYRRYDQNHLERLMFIRRCRTLEMTQDEIRELLYARADPDASCATINELIDAHLVHVQQRMAELSALEAELAELRAQCLHAHSTRECGILRELDHGSEEALANAPPPGHKHP